GVVTAESDRDVVAGVVLAPRRQIRGHEREAVLGLQPCMHDLVGDAWIVTELAEQVRREFTAEHAPVELHGFAGVAIEPQVRIEPSSHRTLLALWEHPRTGASPQANAGPADAPGYRPNRSMAATRVSTTLGDPVP